MDTYIYGAALYCEPCGQKIRDGHKAHDLAPANPDDESSYDSDDYPKGPYPDGGGEADCPLHCDACHVFLENPLTDEGRDYVAEKVADALARVLKGLDATIDPGSALAVWIHHYDVCAGVSIDRTVRGYDDGAVLRSGDLVREPAPEAAEIAAGQSDGKGEP